MIIKDKKDYGLLGIQQEGDNNIYTHYQDIEGVLEDVANRRGFNNGGWSGERSQRYIGSIPFIEIEKNPELKAAINSGDSVAIEAAVRLFFATEEGRRYCANPFDTGKSGQVIVK